MFLPGNLVLLRKRRRKTQDDVACGLGLNSSTLDGYEHGVGNPNLERLIALTRYYKGDLDDLVRRDLRQLGERELQALEGRSAKSGEQAGARGD